MQIKGIECGNVIKLLETVEIPDDTEIFIEVPPARQTIDRERWEKMKAFLKRPRSNEEKLLIEQ